MRRHPDRSPGAGPRLSPRTTATEARASLRFQVEPDLPGGWLWSVVPEQAGRVTQDGLFTAGAHAMTCQVLAAWALDVQTVAVAEVAIETGGPGLS